MQMTSPPVIVHNPPDDYYQGLIDSQREHATLIHHNISINKLIWSHVRIQGIGHAQAFTDQTRNASRSGFGFLMNRSCLLLPLGVDKPLLL